MSVPPYSRFMANRQNTINRASSVYDTNTLGGQSELEVAEPRKTNRLRTIVSSGPGSSASSQAQQYIAELGSPRPHIVPDDCDLKWTAEEKPQQHPEKEKICGLIPAVFWVVILLIILLVSAGIGVGLGMGFGTTNCACQRYGAVSSRKRSFSEETLCFTDGVDMYCSNNRTAKSLTFYVNDGGFPSPQTHKPNHGVSTFPATVISTATSTAPLVAFTNPSIGGSTFSGGPSPGTSCPGNNSDKVAFPYAINGTAIQYTIHCNSNYGAGVKTGIKDLQVIPNVKDLTQCLVLCSAYTVQLPAPAGTRFGAFCSGVTYSGSFCWLKSGVLPGAKGDTGGGDGAILVHDPSWTS